MAGQRKSVLITGASGHGIGNHLALTFHNQGFRVFATARKAENLEDLKAKGIETLSLLVDDEDSIKACYREVCKLLGSTGLDYLINNAGRGYTMPTTDVDIAEAKATFDTNFFGVIQVNQTFMPLLLRSKGTIVHVGSVAGYMPFIFGSVYNSSKAALHAYCDCLRVELAPFGVHVLNIVTGGVISNIARTKRTLPEDSIFKPNEPIFQQRLTTSQTQGIDTQIYATAAVKAILGSRGWLWNANEAWLGGGARLVWFIETLDWWTPGGMWQRLMGRVFKLPSTLEAPESRKNK